MYQRGCHQTDLREIGFWDFMKDSLEMTDFVNTLRTGDADLRFYITTVQDG